MRGSTPNPFVGESDEGTEVVHLAQSLDPERRGRRLALFASAGVLAVAERVVGAGVDHQKLNAALTGVPGDLLGGPVAAVDQQGVCRPPEERDGLVHAARRGAGHLPFCAHTDRDQAVPHLVVRFDTHGVTCRQGSDTLQRRRARQSGTDRNAAVHDYVHARNPQSGLPHGPHHAGHIRSPPADLARPELPKRRIGVRLTGGAVDAVLTDMEATSLSTVSKPLANTDPDTVTQTITQAVAELGSGIPAEGRVVSSLGVGVGGQVAPDGSVLSAVFLGWENVRITDRLRELTGVETHLENDVVALTAAEHWFGAGRGRPDLGMLTIGTGVGSGLVMHHKVVASIDAGVGLLGHLPLGMPGPRCPVGHVGCATAVLTESSLVAQASVALGQPVGLAELFTLAGEARHPAIRRICADVATGLGRLVAVIANVAQVPLVIVAGECVSLAALVIDDVRAEVASLRNPAASPVELILHEIGTEEWARGAAVVAIQRFVTAVGKGRSQT